MKNSVLVVVDMQEGLFARNVYKKEKLMQNINLLIDAFGAKGIPVVYFRHTNDSFSKKDTAGWQLCAELHKHPDDIVFDKSNVSVFKVKAFDIWLQDKGIKRICFAGLVSNGCVQYACRDALARGYDTVLASDAHSTWHKDAETIVEGWTDRLVRDGVTAIASEKLANQVLSE
jgi:Amidases related to nicotinamidase